MHLDGPTAVRAYLSATASRLPEGEAVTLTASSINAPTGVRYLFQRKTPTASQWTDIDSAGTATTKSRTDAGTMQYRVRLQSSAGVVLDDSDTITVTRFSYSVSLSYPTQGQLRQDYNISAVAGADAPVGYTFRFQSQSRGRIGRPDIPTAPWRTMQGGEGYYVGPFGFRTSEPTRWRFRVQLLSPSGALLATDTSNIVEFRG